MLQCALRVKVMVHCDSTVNGVVDCCGLCRTALGLLRCKCCESAFASGTSPATHNSSKRHAAATVIEPKWLHIDIYICTDT